MTLDRCPIAWWAGRAPESVALRFEADGRVVDVSYGVLDATVAEVAARLSGVQVGVPVGVLIDDPVQLLVHVWALFRLGARVCLLNTRLPDAALEAALQVVGANQLVTDQGGVGRRYVHAVPQEFAPSSEARRSTSDSIAQASTVVFTSGSSGRPKGVLHRFEAHMRSAAGSSANLPVSPGDAWALVLPQYHVGGLSISFRCFLGGATVAIPNAATPPADAFERLRATHASIVGVQLQRLLAESRLIPGLRLLVGGSAVPYEHLAEAEERGWTVHATYGLTEMGSQVTTTNGTNDRGELRTSGRLLPNRELRIDEEGRILVRGGTRFDGYVVSGGFEKPFDEDGWFKTGDLGVLDEEGRLVVRGRADRVFVSGGENISPEAIERVLGSVAGIEKAAVVAVSDPEFGARPVAFVHPPPDDRVIGRIRDTLVRHLPRYALPVRYLPYPENTASGISKVDYANLARLAEQSQSDGNRR